MPTIFSKVIIESGSFYKILNKYWDIKVPQTRKDEWDFHVNHLYTKQRFNAKKIEVSHEN